MQSLDKYRGDGAGAVDPAPSSNYSQKDLSLFNAIDQLGAIFANNPNGLRDAINEIEPEKLELYKKYKSEQ